MSVLELKGEMHELISEVHSPLAARRLLEMIRTFVQNLPEEPEDAVEQHMSDEQVAALQEAIELSYEKRNRIPHSVAREMLEQWLNRNPSNG